MIPEGPWRVGSHVGKNLYVDDGSGPAGRGRDVGRMDSPELAAFVVDAVNARHPDSWDGVYERTLRAQVDRMEAEIHRLRIELVRAAEPGRTLDEVRAGARAALAVPR